MEDKVIFTLPGGKEWLISALSSGPVQVLFSKKNGEERLMNCTLQESVVPVYEKKTDKIKQKNEEVLSVWDLDKSEWRSFRLDSIKKITFGE